MKKKIYSLFKNQWFVGAFFFTISSISITVFWNVVKSFIVLAYDYFNINIEIPLWGLILLPIVSILLLILILVIIARHDESKNNTTAPKYLEYTEDFIEGNLWIFR